MTDENSEKIPFEKRMKSLKNYFKRNSESNNAFKSEYEAAQKINKIALKENVSKNDVKEIVQIFNKANLTSHYGGTGWFDFRLHIQSLITGKEMKYRMLSNGNIELL